jgi:hypothetical protein
MIVFFALGFCYFAVDRVFLRILPCGDNKQERQQLIGAIMRG